MKWIKALPSEGDTRIKTVFALWPITLYTYGKRETRWLCWTKIQQIYCGGYADSGWDDLQFID